jgi:gamma-butyrobetaine dioxygenase
LKLGGQSTFLDSFKAVQILREKYPQDFDVLTKVPVTFHYRNDGHIMRYRRPTIVTNDANEDLKVYYAPPFQGPMDVEEELTVPFYSAFQKFTKILQDPSLTYRTLSRPGDLVLFHNRRVLHGRDEFDAQSGNRHFKGTYVDIDMFKDKLATLEEKLGHKQQ